MKLHRWLLSAVDMARTVTMPPTMRAYKCSACKSGPIWVSAISPKVKINQIAKEAGIPSDCNEALVKEVMSR